MSSIQRRLGLGLTTILIIVGLTFAQLSLWLFDAGLRRYLEIQLEEESQTLLSALVQGVDGVMLNTDRISASYDKPFSGSYFVIDFVDTHWRSRSLWDQSLNIPEVLGLQDTLSAGPQNQQLLLYKAEYRRFGEQVTIVTAKDYTPIIEGFAQARWASVLLGFGCLVLVLLLQRFIVKQALQPLDNVKQQIEQLQSGQRTQLDHQVATELKPLVSKINHLLKSTEDIMQRSRDSSGNLGHALKTPLAVLFNLLNRQVLQDDVELKNIMQQQLQTIEQKIARELAKARLGGDALPGSYFICRKELPSIVEILQQVHARDLTIKWYDNDNLSLPWNREDMLELIGNLLDNACKWAERNVKIEFNKTASHYHIKVEDDGPGIAEEDYERVLGRGKRLDEYSAQGHGLGLGIAKDIVQHCAGEMHFSRSVLGGLAIEILLPVRPIGQN